MSMLQIRDLKFSYSGRVVLEGLSFEVEAEKFMTIAGPNGAGKSTLLNLMSRTLKLQSGKILVAGKEIGKYSTKELAKQIAIVRQEHVPAFGFTVRETVSMARTMFYDKSGFESKADREIVVKAMEATDTTEFANRQLGQISGGERQRVFIARALAQETPILLLDEPTSFLDLRHQVGVYDLLKKMQTDSGKTIISITHDINLARQYCDEVLLLGGGKEYLKGDCGEALSAENIGKVFGVEGFSGPVGEQDFFLPLGKHAKDRGSTEKQQS